MVTLIKFEIPEFDLRIFYSLIDICQYLIINSYFILRKYKFFQSKIDISYYVAIFLETLLKISPPQRFWRGNKLKLG